MKHIFTTALLVAGLSFTTSAQEVKMPAPSPSAVLKQDFSTSNIEISYSRPSMRGRKVFGELVPFGQVWRTGANSATKVTFGEDVSLNGNPIKAGTYALYTKPGANQWQIIINKGIGNWGVSGFDEKDDVATFNVPAQKLNEAVQSFTISIDNITINSCDITLTWENTKVVIPVKADNNKRISDYLEKSINNPNRPYKDAANYYLETNQNLDKAETYATKAIEASNGAFYLYWLKARILAKNGKKAEALEAAKKAADGAPDNYKAEYQGNYERLMKELK